MKKKHQIVLIDTDKESKILLNPDNNILYTTTEPVGKGHHKLKHLYILSDDEIKEGDWFVWASNGEEENGWNLERCKKLSETDVLNTNYKIQKKIIATTDSSLKIYESETLAKASGFSLKSDDILLPRLSGSFVEKYIELYNNGNPIVDVMVEYYEHIIGNMGSMDYPNFETELRLKLHSNNEVIISLIDEDEKKYSKKEIYNFLEDNFLNIRNTIPDAKLAFKHEYINNLLKNL
jgi:hypothetical protein